MQASAFADQMLQLHLLGDCVGTRLPRRDRRTVAIYIV